MASSIQRKVAARLVLAWLILSLVLGALTYRMESRRADNVVFDLVTEAAEHVEALGSGGSFPPIQVAAFLRLQTNFTPPRTPIVRWRNID